MRLGSLAEMLAGLLALAAVIGLYSTAGPLFHLNHVRIDGDHGVVNESDVRAGLKLSGEMSLVYGDFAALESHLTSLPAVRKAQVRKLPPHSLLVEIAARDAVARSADGGLVDSSGEWYPGDSHAELPVFSMPRSRMPQAADFYLEATGLLDEHELGINQMQYSNEGLRLFLSNGWILLLGEHKIRQRLQRFVKTLPKLEMALKDGGSLRFDLRYPHGMAVAGLREQGEGNG